MDFGKNFLKARNRKGIDQKDAAAALGISAAFLSKIERNKSKPSIDLIMKSADFYGVEAGFFFQDPGNLNLENLYTRKNKKFLRDMDLLSISELQDTYSIKLDEQELTEEELKGIIAYLRSVRSLQE